MRLVLIASVIPERIPLLRRSLETWLRDARRQRDIEIAIRIFGDGWSYMQVADFWEYIRHINLFPRVDMWLDFQRERSGF